jgi:hypothetical protein
VQFARSGLTILQLLELLQQQSIGFIGAAGSLLLTEEVTWWGGKLTPAESNSNCRGIVARPQGRRPALAHLARGVSALRRDPRRRWNAAHVPPPNLRQAWRLRFPNISGILLL